MNCRADERTSERTHIFSLDVAESGRRVVGRIVVGLARKREMTREKKRKKKERKEEEKKEPEREKLTFRSLRRTNVRPKDSSTTLG